MQPMITVLKPRKAINKAFLKVKPNRTEIEKFKYKPVYVSQPILQINGDQQRQIIEIVKSILSVKENDPETNRAIFESQIDQLVYQLYDLTPEEIAIVENAVK